MNVPREQLPPAPEKAQAVRDSGQDDDIAELRTRLSRRETLNLVAVVAGAAVAIVALGLSWKTAVDGDRTAVAAERLTVRAVTAAEISAKAAQDAVSQNRDAGANQLKASLQTASDALIEAKRQTEAGRDAIRLDQRA
jgi:hypothetical protein